MLRVATPEDLGVDRAKTVMAMHAELVKEGLDKQLVERLVELAAGAMHSSDGNCGELAREALVGRPMR